MPTTTRSVVLVLIGTVAAAAVIADCDGRAGTTRSSYSYGHGGFWSFGHSHGSSGSAGSSASSAGHGTSFGGFGSHGGHGGE